MWQKNAGRWKVSFGEAALIIGIIAVPILINVIPIVILYLLEKFS